MMLITVKDLLDYSIDQEYSMMAHICYWAITTQNVQLEDDSKVIDQLAFGRQAITQLMQQNVLGLGQIKLYVITVNKHLYAFYFARNGLEAASHHKRIFREQPQNISEAPRLMHKLMHLTSINKEIFLIDYRKQILQFPAYIGHARSGEYVLHRYDGQAVSRVV
ncbi:hypothetical protein [Lysinibacillus sp. LZ02]|uniref:hypothetical protein n=1 Tax=Lysinibacillus sp. LZ02 TaxID=3420668 RepID=UPI003D36FA22